MKIQRHRLTGTGVSFVESPNHGGSFASPLPDTLVIHFTAGASLNSSVRSLCDPASKASAHAVVGREGAIVQLVPFDVIAWHAGASTLGARTGLNKFSIGIEIDNAGRLTPTAAGDFVTWFGKRVQKRARYKPCTGTRRHFPGGIPTRSVRSNSCSSSPGC